VSRLPYPEPASVPPAVQALLDARPPRNVFRMLAHATELMPGLMELTGAILYRAKLDPISRELAVLRVGHLCGSHYEVAQHRKIAAAVGLSPAKIDGSSREAEPGLYDARELLVLRFAEQVVRRVKVDAELFAATLAAFGPERTIELLVVIGTYVMLAQVLENAEVELESGGAGPASQDVEKIFGDQAAR
jgi:4-carboxymuconolactone decarboxylase